MTATTTDLTDAASRTPLVAALGITAASVLTAVGTFWAVNDSKDADHSASDWFITLGMIAVVAALAYGLGVRGASSGNPARRAVVLAVLGVVTVVVFWSGAPMVLVSAAIACALADKDQTGSYRTGSKVALALSALTTAAAIALAIAG